MENVRQDGAALTRCSHYTIVSLVGVVFFVMFTFASDKTRNFSQSQAQNQCFANSVIPTSGNWIEDPCGFSTEENQHPSAAVPAELVTVQTGAVSAAMIHQMSGAEQTHVDLDNIVVASVILHQDESKSSRLTVYFSNFSNQAGLVQLMSEYRADTESGTADGSWQRRRVPRHDYLVYSFDLPSDQDLSAVRLHIRTTFEDRVDTYRLTRIDSLDGNTKDLSLSTEELYTSI